MTTLISFIIISTIILICISDHKTTIQKETNYFNKKILESNIQGNNKDTDMYIEALVRLK